jgi:hypothetical protein
VARKGWWEVEDLVSFGEHNAGEGAQAEAERKRAAKAEAKVRERDLIDETKRGGVEYRRTCLRCAREWYVRPLLVAIESGVHPKKVVAGLGNPLVVQEIIREMQDAKRCPACGSGGYEQERVELPTSRG